MFQQVILSILVTFHCSNLGFTKPALLKNEAINQQSRHQDTQSLSDAFQPEESIKQENDVTSGLDEFLERPSAHNRTARNAFHPCVLKIRRMRDSCRNKHVEKYECKSSHTFCSLTTVPPCCKPVMGYWESLLFKPKCPEIPIGCHCGKNC